MEKLLIALCLVELVGCATQAVLPSQAKQAPMNNVFKHQEIAKNDDAKLIVVRDKGYLGSGCSTGVYINNEKSAVLEPGEKVTFILHPGEWSVAMKGEGALCISDDVPSGRDVELKPRETKAVRLFADPAGNIDLKPLPLM
ncbi:hypothetical protein [Enterobacter sp. R4-368]|uniref:hypothetical protein n=1 Tax=Enterobacter sp. R4-368 TaxID=1166130 RepID=UPI00034F148D|nr:hypothetical protein [Enterobacter sp. R4-368]AGN84915.1 hypothetical protein H650_06760 [Enterobacter sp. R4-368]